MQAFSQRLRFLLEDCLEVNNHLLLLLRRLKVELLLLICTLQSFICSNIFPLLGHLNFSLS